MKVVILAGGFGTRISEESQLKPKPMIEIGSKPIIWHIMKMYSHFGYNDFIICAGYKQSVIKEYFSNYFIHNSDVTFDLSDNQVNVHYRNAESWKVTIIDTGLNTMTGGRIKRIRDYIKEDNFLLTYGDGVSDVDIDKLVESHNSDSKRLVTLTGVHPEGRFGVLDLSKDGKVNSFREKKQSDTGLINGGFMVVSSKIFDYIDGDETTFEKDPLERVAEESGLFCYEHRGFWQCMDTLRDKERLEKIWISGNAPWKVW